MANKDYLNEYRIFFEHFAQSIDPYDQLPVKLGRYKLTNKEVIGAIIYWTSQYLKEKKCPQNLISTLTSIVIDETRRLCQKQPINYGFNPSDEVYEPLKLMQAVVALINEICTRYLDNSMLCSLPPPGAPYNAVSIYAMKNCRRLMEDRHVVVHDLNTIFNKKEATPSSYYAIFDGHAGIDAAMYSAAHLHQYLAENDKFPSNAESALLEAFDKTDEMFLAKCQKENFISGTTAVCALLLPKEKTLYIAWVGDSQALLVKQGEVLQCVEPHKPNRTDERMRIENLGGTVRHQDIWRVNGQLAISRAIGDLQLKPFIIAEPDIREVPLEGTEDFLILASDGFWDHVSHYEAADVVYHLIQQNQEDTDRVSKLLVLLAKDSGSVDNITVIVVFLRETQKIAQAGAQRKPRKAIDEQIMEKELILDNTTKCERITKPFFMEDDYGPETNVDALTDGSPSPNYERAISPNVETDSSANNNKRAANPFDDDDDKPTEPTTTEALTPSDEAPPTAPINDVHDAGLIDTGVDSDSEDEEWNYVRGEEANKENLDPSQLISQVAIESDDNMSQLNPDAEEFVPFSPTKTASSPISRVIDEENISQSPKRAVDIDFLVPNPSEFDSEVKTKPHEIESDKAFSNGHTEETNGTTNPFSDEVDLINKEQQKEEFHFGPNATPFIPGKLFDSSETSTKALFGDDTLTHGESFTEGFLDLTNRNDPMSMSFHQDRDEPVDLNKVHPIPDDSFMNQTISDLEEHFPLGKSEEQDRPELITDLDVDVKNDELNGLEERFSNQKIDDSPKDIPTENMLDLVPNEAFVDKPSTLNVESEVMSSESSSQLTSPIKTPEIPKSDIDLIAEQISNISEEPRQPSPIPDLMVIQKTPDIMVEEQEPKEPNSLDIQTNEMVPIRLAESPVTIENRNETQSALINFANENPFLENVTRVEVHVTAVESEISNTNLISPEPIYKSEAFGDQACLVDKSLEAAALNCPLPDTPKSATDIEYNSETENRALPEQCEPTNQVVKEVTSDAAPDNIFAEPSALTQPNFNALLANTSTPLPVNLSRTPELIAGTTITPIQTEPMTVEAIVKPEEKTSKTTLKKEPTKTKPATAAAAKRPTTATRTNPATSTKPASTTRLPATKTTAARASSTMVKSKIDSARPAPRPTSSRPTSSTTIDTKKQVNGVKSTTSTTSAKTTLASRTIASTTASRPTTARTVATSSKPKTTTLTTKSTTSATKPMPATTRSPASKASTLSATRLAASVSPKVPLARPKPTTIASKEPLSKPAKDATNKLTATRTAPRSTVASKLSAASRSPLSSLEKKPSTSRTTNAKMPIKKPNEAKPITKPQPKENGVSEPANDVVNGIGDK